MPKTTVALVSLGCPKNLVDSQAMLGLLQQAGYQIIEELAEAAVVIVNTCAFIEPAQEEAVEALLDLAELKQGKCRALIGTGCLPQRHGQGVLDELTEVDAFVAVGAEARIVEAVERALQGQRVFLDGPLTHIFDGSTPRVHTGPPWLAYLKVADGCDHACTFCTIPQIRGRYRSIPIAGVRRQFEDLVREGVREICLVAQDTSAYGRDLLRGAEGQAGGVSRPSSLLPELLDALAQVPFDGWVRLQYLHPQNVNSGLIERLCSGPPFVPYFDIPLQHASQRILRAMGRRGNAEEYLALIERIRAVQPDAAIRTTFILGFPGETEADFTTLVEFVQQAQFDRLSCFRYWPEEGTPSAQMPHQVPAELAQERLDELMRLQEDISRQRNRRFLGRRLTVLVEGRTKRSNILRGRSFRDAPEVDCEVKLVVPAGVRVAAGEFVEVEVTAAEVYDLRGHLVGPAGGRAGCRRM